MIKKEIYSVDQVLSEVKSYDAKEGKRFVEFDGDMMKMESQRYRLFKRDGTICVTCKLEGTFFRKERHEHDKQFHFNLYGINENNEEILFTKDHIIPKSKGGKNILSNYQVMCYTCNHIKGNK